MPKLAEVSDGGGEIHENESCGYLADLALHDKVPSVSLSSSSAISHVPLLASDLCRSPSAGLQCLENVSCSPGD